ncbi:molybdate ABC transporter substrate-binding protein [Morganella psychrotolerans]|uniref:Molybdate ABC transporter substrate-binding protein n=1 Tax=Morganella psychrotolerans TaxID=368603 RepID=A0A1B8GZ99_9GAMM|nr:molybdate ABC transporter substrate-binding protein [Morganella psychrotolerans]OBU02150.1 molybdate ABC transporter substrate-binding protein [Morganella psychrotolerans]
MSRRLMLSALLLCCSVPAAIAAQLHMYAGAGLRPPVEKIIDKFEKETGNKVAVEYGGSGQILTRFELTKQGDLFFPGSADYVEKLQKENLVTESHPIVRHIPVIAVRRDKADGIKTVADLAASNLRIGMGDPKAIALGRSGELLLDASGYGDVLRDKVIVRAATIKHLSMYLLNGEVDAAVIGRADAMKNQDKLLVLPSPEGAPEEVATLAVLSTSAAPEEAKRLAAYFSSPEGIKAFTDYGFLPVRPAESR